MGLSEDTARPTAAGRRHRLGLNPQAAEFVPQRFSLGGQAAFRKWAHNSLESQLQLVPGSQSAEETFSAGFEDLPLELITKILSRLDTRSAASCARSCRQFSLLVKEAPVCLRLRSGAEQPLCTAAAWERLRGVQHCFPGVVELDLTGLPVEDHQVLSALSALKHLRGLQLAGCTKLTSSMVSTAVSQKLLARLTFLNLQRCFQLDNAALDLILTASAQPSASLTTLALSHLFLYSWPSAAQPLQPTQAQAQIIQAEATLSQPVANASEPVAASRDSVGSSAAPSVKLNGPRTSSLRILALHNCSKVSAAALQSLASACPQLEMLLLGGCSFAPAMSRPGQQTSSASTARRQPQHWLHCLDIPVDSALVSALVEPASSLPHLKMLELSHAPALTAAAVAADLAQQRNRVQVVNLCSTEGVEAMAVIMAEAESGKSSLPMRQVQLAVLTAVNCSSAAARHTPLHLAAADGRHADLLGLLRMGARVDMTDRSGATSLFSACENGHAPCVLSLLTAGSPIARSNAVGEACLYIAALKGHEACVEVLLEHLISLGLPWMDKELYGDGWTPLMAAAVADHCGIVMRLLTAAGPHAKAMTSHTNRNGLTAAHVAARRGCLPVLRYLLAVGGGAIAATHDHACKTPIEVAERNGRWAAAALLRDAIRAH